MKNRADLGVVQAVVRGDDPPAARQNPQYVEWAYQSLLEAFLRGAKTLTAEAIQETIPAILFRLAIDVDWIRYLDENGDPLPDRVGDVEKSGYLVSQELWDEFMTLVPVDDFEDFVTVRSGSTELKWKHPTPKELIEGFIGPRRRPSQAWLARQMCETPGYSKSPNAAIQFIKLRLKEPCGTQAPKRPGLRQASVLVRIFKAEDPVRYADLRPHDFFWQEAASF